MHAPKPCVCRNAGCKNVGARSTVGNASPTFALAGTPQLGNSLHRRSGTWLVDHYGVLLIQGAIAVDCAVIVLCDSSSGSAFSRLPTKASKSLTLRVEGVGALGHAGCTQGPGALGGEVWVGDGGQRKIRPWSSSFQLIRMGGQSFGREVCRIG